MDAGGEYPSRVENGEGYLLTKGAIDGFYAHCLSDPGQIEEPHASPIRGSLAGLPPATVITAGYDPLRDEGAAYARAMSDAGVTVRSDENPTLIHGFFWMLGVIDETRGAYDRAGADLRAAFGT